MGRGSAGAASKAKAAAASGPAPAKKDRKAEDPFQQHGDLTPREFEAFSAYQGMHYADINFHLRQTATAHLADPAALTHIPALQSLIGKNTLKRDITVYRGVQPHPGFDPASIRAGDVYSDKAFFSTSTKKSVAAGFADELAGGGAVFHIKAPKGTKALPGYKLGTGSTFQASEREVLFNTGSSVKVGKVRKDKSGTYHFYGTLQ